MDNSSTNLNEPAIKYDKDNMSDEFDLKDIIRNLWQKRKFIFVVTGVTLLLGTLIAYMSPTQYTAVSVIHPQSSRQSTSSANLGGIAALAGVNLGATIVNEGSISTSMYPQIINSLPFVREIMQVPITVEKSQGKEITLYEYYSNKEYRENNRLSIIRKYTISLPRTIISTFQPKGKQQINSNIPITPDSSGIIKITHQEQRVYNAIKNAIQYEYNSRQGVITLGYTFPEALAAAQVSEQLHKTLEKYVINYKTEVVQENLMFVEQSYQKAQKDFLQKQANLAVFQDANRGLITATSRATETQLRSEYDIAFTIYNELARQREQAQLAVEETKPVLTVINPVIVPLNKSAPQRARTIALSLILGLVLSIVWVLTLPFFRDILGNIKQGEVK